MCHILKEPFAHDASPCSSSQQNCFEMQPCPFPCNGKKWSRLDYTIVPPSWCRININQLDSVIDFLINKAFVSACITTQSLMGSLLYLKSWLYVCGFAPAPGSPVARLAGLSLTRGGDCTEGCFTSLSGETKRLSHLDDGFSPKAEFFKGSSKLEQKEAVPWGGKGINRAVGRGEWMSISQHVEKCNSHLVALCCSVRGQRHKASLHCISLWPHWPHWPQGAKDEPKTESCRKAKLYEGRCVLWFPSLL